MHKYRPLIVQVREWSQPLARVLLALAGPTQTACGRPQGVFAGLDSQRRAIGLALLLVATLLISSVAAAFTAPAAGDFGYDVYDIVVNQILNGPIGFIGGLFLIVFGATQIMKNWVLTILCIIAGTVLIRAEALVVTLGAVVG